VHAGNGPASSLHERFLYWIRPRELEELGCKPSVAGFLRSCLVYGHNRFLLVPGFIACAASSAARSTRHAVEWAARRAAAAHRATGESENVAPSPSVLHYYREHYGRFAAKVKCSKSVCSRYPALCRAVDHGPVGIFCLPPLGHLNPSPRSPKSCNAGPRNHLLQLPICRARPESRIEFETLAERDFPVGSFAERYKKMSTLDALAATQASLEILTSQAEAVFRTARPVIERAALDLWIVDNMDYAASTLAACMGAPFVTVIFGLMWHPEPGVPGWSGEPYTNDPAALERDYRFTEAALAVSKPFRDYVGSYRMQAGLGPFSFDTLWSGLAQISQEPAEFEFPQDARLFYSRDRS
jgi:hypothetical protein